MDLYYMLLNSRQILRGATCLRCSLPEADSAVWQTPNVSHYVTPCENADRSDRHSTNEEEENVDGTLAR